MAHQIYLRCSKNSQEKNIYCFYPQTVGLDSEVRISLNNFLEDILQPTSLKMSQTSDLGL